jgi:hypothetical protein
MQGIFGKRSHFGLLVCNFELNQGHETRRHQKAHFNVLNVVQSLVCKLRIHSLE